jgi:hypothetical protein
MTFSYTRFPVNKINVEKIFKIMRKLLFNYSFYSHLEIGKFQGVTNLPPLNGISSGDSKKEEARRRVINKNIAPKVGRRSSTFVDRCETFNLFLCWLLGSSSE